MIGRCPHLGHEDEHCPCVDPGNENGPPAAAPWCPICEGVPAGQVSSLMEWWHIRHHPSLAVAGVVPVGGVSC